MPEFSPEWNACFESYIESVASKSGSRHSPAKYRRLLTKFFEMHPGLSPERFVRSDVETFIRLAGEQPGREGKPVSFSTMGTRLSVISSFYKFAASYGVLGPDGLPHALLQSLAPTTNVRTPEREKAPYRSLTEDDLRRFFSVIPTDSVRGLRDKSMCLFLFWTARRSSEMLSLTWQDLKRGIIHDPVTGARRTAMIYSWEGKGHSRQTDSQELPQVVYESILRYLEASHRLATIQPGDIVFTSVKDRSDREPGQPLRHASLYTIVRGYSTAASLDVCPHAFRHSAAMHRYLAGSSLLDVSHVLRHRSISMTARYLSELVNEQDNGLPLLEQRFASL